MSLFYQALIFTAVSTVAYFLATKSLNIQISLLAMILGINVVSFLLTQGIYKTIVINT
ncbi:MAG: hypothetical protein QXE51_05980 [Nitrososphaeria archaeon]